MSVWTIIIIVVILFIFFGKKSTTTSQKTKTCTMINSVEKSYVEYLQEFSNVIYTVAESSQPNAADLQVCVTISKQNDRYCKVNFSIFEDCITLPSNIIFGGSIEKSDNDSIWFKADNATGFSNPNEVRNTVIRQITTNTSTFKVALIKDEVYTHGDFAVHPFVSCTFKVIYS